MMEETGNVILTDTLKRLGTDAYSNKKGERYAANYWINRYTTLDISRLLRDKSLTFSQISDMFGFSSPAYFSCYVQQHLGVNPTEYRG